MTIATMLFVQILLLVLAFSACAANNMHEDFAELNNALPLDVTAASCCLPPKWQGLIGVTSAVYFKQKKSADVFSYAYDYACDAPAKKMAMKVYKDYSKFVARIVQDFGGHRQYVIVGKSCNVTRLPNPWQDQCIPNSMKVANLNFGLHPHTLHGNTYVVPVQGIHEAITLTDNCIPIGAQALFDTRDAKGFVSTGYMNITTTFNDPHIFDVPSSCRHEEEKSIHLTTMEELLPSLINPFKRR